MLESLCFTYNYEIDVNKCVDEYATNRRVDYKVYRSVRDDGWGPLRIIEYEWWMGYPPRIGCEGWIDYPL